MEFWHRHSFGDSKGILAEREGFEPPGGVTTTASKPTAALTNGDLSIWHNYREVFTWRSLRNVLLFHRIDADDSKELPKMIARTDQQSHKPMLPEDECKGQSDRIHTNGNQ